MRRWRREPDRDTRRSRTDKPASVTPLFRDPRGSQLTSQDRQLRSWVRKRRNDCQDVEKRAKFARWKSREKREKRQRWCGRKVEFDPLVRKIRRSKASRRRLHICRNCYHFALLNSTEKEEIGRNLHQSRRWYDAYLARFVFLSALFRTPQNVFKRKETTAAIRFWALKLS